MKATKFIVGAGALIGIIGTFTTWIDIEMSEALRKMAGPLPESGMDNGGGVFIFLLLFPLLAAIIGIAKRFGRGMGAMAMIGGLLSSFMGLVKYADIQDAATELTKVGGTASPAIGYWVMFIGSMIAFVGGLIALIKPEPKPEAAAAMPQHGAHPGGHAGHPGQYHYPAQ